MAKVDFFSRIRFTHWIGAVLSIVGNSEVTTSLKRFWELESIGITEAENPTMSREEEFVVTDFNK